MKEFDHKTTKNIIIIVSLVIYFTSLTQTALTYKDLEGIKNHSSISLIFMGGLAILGGGLLEWFIWLANPLYFLGLFFIYKDDIKSIKFTIPATILAMTFLTWKEILASESGRNATIQSLNLGYWLWLISLTFSTIGTIFYFRLFEENNK